jgi:AraC-like DNA-binding protein
MKQIIPQSVHKIQQAFWRHSDYPHIEIRTTRDSHQAYKTHTHAEISIGLIEQGQTALQCPQSELILSQDDIVLLPPGLPHACNPLPGTTRSYQMIYIQTAWAMAILSRVHHRPVLALHPHAVQLVNPELAATLRKTSTALQRNPDIADQTVFDRCVIQILCAAAPTWDNRPPSPLSQFVKTELLASLTAPPALAELACKAGCTVETLIRNFRRDYGMTPKAFLNNVRVETAKSFLRLGWSLVATALEVGFSDQSQFHKAFVTYTASTPGQYQSASISDKTATIIQP